MKVKKLAEILLKHERDQEKKVILHISGEKTDKENMLYEVGMTSNRHLDFIIFNGSHFIPKIGKEKDNKLEGLATMIKEITKMRENSGDLKTGKFTIPLLNCCILVVDNLGGDSQDVEIVHFLLKNNWHDVKSWAEQY